MSRRRVAVIAAVTGAALIGAVIVFQLAVALGAPLGRLTQGGGVDGTLPMSGRMVAVGSAVLLAVMALGLLARAGIGPLRAAPRRLVTAIAWFTAIYAGLGVAAQPGEPVAGGAVDVGPGDRTDPRVQRGHAAGNAAGLTAAAARRRSRRSARRS